MNDPTTQQIIRDLAGRARESHPLQRHTVICHPRNVKLVEQCCQKTVVSLGIPIYTSEHLPERCQRWEFPKDRFVEYEKKDEAWAIPLRFGKWVDGGPYLLLVDLEQFEQPQFFRTRFDMGMMGNPVVKDISHIVTCC